MVTAVLLLLAAQDANLFEKAPPHIDEALRARISKFYQAFVDGKFRQADAVVAEESKDEFFNADRNRCKSFEIVKIVYHDDFTRARVVVICEMEMMLGARMAAAKVPFGTNWKAVNGEWFWYHIPADPKAGRETPFGPMRGGTDTGKPSDAAPSDAAAKQMALNVITAIKPSVTEVMLSSYEESSAEVVLTNTMGKATLAIDPLAVEGLRATLDVAEIRTRESARLTLKYSPPNKSPKSTQVLRVRVTPSGQVIEIVMKFAVPPEIQKLIPKIP